MPVSASTDIDKPVEVQPIPNPDDCNGPNYSIAYRLRRIVHRYNMSPFNNPNYTLDKFHADMNSALIKPELINCKIVIDGHHDNGHTFINAMLNTAWYPLSTDAYIEATKWALSKGYDLSIKVDNPSGPYSYHHNMTAAEMAKQRLQYYSKYKDSDDPAWTVFPEGITYHEIYILYKKLVELLEPPPALATKPCAEVDGQTPPANEYCFLTDNMQSSVKDTRTNNLVPKATRYYVDDRLAGMALFKGWKTIVSFQCNAPAGKTCDSNSYTTNEDWPVEVSEAIKDDYGTSVRCGFSTVKVPVIIVDSMESGEVRTSTHETNIEYSHPSYRVCEANSNQPFTLRIQTTRLAK